MARLVLLIVSFVVLASCNERNPEFCKNSKNADDPFCKVGGACTANSSCTSTPNFPVCDLAENGGTCVSCTADDHAQCKGTTPHCEDHACVACFDDHDCENGAGVCLPSGSCAASDGILHAKSNGSGMTCSVSNPCSLDAALVAAKSGPRVIKLDDAGPYTSMVNYTVDVDAGTPVTIDARNATIHRNGSSPIFTINDDKGVTILGGTIEGPTGGTTEAIRCGNRSNFAAYGTTIRMSDGVGINAPGGCILTLSRSRIESNQGGGLTITNSKFVIVGNMFLGNGGPGGQNGAVTISTAADSSNRFEFNTIANNATASGIVTAGVDCRAGTGFIASHNIIWNNMVGGNANVVQVVNNCMHVSSDIGPMPVAGNISDPPALSADGHLGAGSPASSKAESATDLSGLAARDIDGDRRVAPADLGADQLPRP